MVKYSGTGVSLDYYLSLMHDHVNMLVLMIIIHLDAVKGHHYYSLVGLKMNLFTLIIK